MAEREEELNSLLMKVKEKTEKAGLKLSIQDKKAVVHIHNGILLSYLKECIWISSNEVDETEPIIQSEVSQKEKHQYSILTHIYGI